MLTLEEIYPPYALSITCGEVELRVLRDEDFPELVELIRGGVQTPGLPMPFNSAWHEVPYSPGVPDAFPATSLTWWWSQRSAMSPERWNLALAVRHRGQIVGIQDVSAKAFPLRSTIETGSWLGIAHHGKGIGTLMRQLVVGFAFDELGAAVCESEYIGGNAASAAVSRKVGYVENGVHYLAQQQTDGPACVEIFGVRVTPETYIRPSAPVLVEGAENLRKFFGITNEH